MKEATLFVEYHSPFIYIWRGKPNQLKSGVVEESHKNIVKWIK